MKSRNKHHRPEIYYQDIVQKYLTKRQGCLTVRELNFAGPKFDVVGFDPDAEEFHIVECKRTKRPVGVGQAFGQILAYKAMIFDAGEDFLTCFEHALVKAGLTRQPFWIHAARFVASRKIPVRFYVALREEACGRPDVLKLIKRDLSAVGILRINQYDQCKDYIRVFGEKDFEICRAVRVDIPIALPIRPDLQKILDEKGSNRNVSVLAAKIDRRILKMRRGMKSVRHGHYAIAYRVTQNFITLRPRNRHLLVSVKESSGWKDIRVTKEKQVGVLVSKARKALDRTIA